MSELIVYSMEGCHK